MLFILHDVWRLRISFLLILEFRCIFNDLDVAFALLLLLVILIMHHFGVNEDNITLHNITLIMIY